MSKNLFYLCGMTPEDASGGIYGCEECEGKVRIKFHHPLRGCSYLGFSDDRKGLYATSIVDGSGAVTALRIREDGSLEQLNQLPTLGRSCCYAAAAPGGKFVYAANYFTSNISEFALNPNGSLKTLARDIHFTGSGPDERQDVPHPHFTNFTPDQKKLIVIDLGTDEIKLFDFDPDKGLLNIEKPSVFKVNPAGSGPRHIVFNKKGDIAYLINEIGNTVSVLGYDGNSFTFKQILSTLPEDFKDYSKAAAIRLAPDERFLFASNRGYDSTAVFAVLPDGLLELREIVSSEGVSPRDINFLPGGRVFAMANEFSDNVAFFDYDEICGKLNSKSREVDLHLPRPLAIYW